MNKNKQLNIRVSEQDYNYIKEKSKQANLTITGYVTKSALNKKILVADRYKEFTGELRKIGININQIAKNNNLGINTNLDLSKFQKDINNIWQSLKSFPLREI